MFAPVCPPGAPWRSSTQPIPASRHQARVSSTWAMPSVRSPSPSSSRRAFSGRRTWSKPAAAIRAMSSAVMNRARYRVQKSAATSAPTSSWTIASIRRGESTWPSRSHMYPSGSSQPPRPMPRRKAGAPSGAMSSVPSRRWKSAADAPRGAAVAWVLCAVTAALLLCVLRAPGGTH